jgi:hypothetical protein
MCAVGLTTRHMAVKFYLELLSLAYHGIRVRRFSYINVVSNVITFFEFCLLGYNARVVRWKSTDVSEEHIASIFMVEE